MQRPEEDCDGLDGNGPQRLIDLSAWSPGNELIRSCILVVGGAALGVALRFLKAHHQAQCLPLCLLPWVRM